MHKGHNATLPISPEVERIADALVSIHKAQVLTYLRFTKVRLGYLINFNTHEAEGRLSPSGPLAPQRDPTGRNPSCSS
jgi:hypothetical protein